MRPDTTVATVLKKAGYATALIGKWGLGDVGGAEAGLPRRHGFDYFFSYLKTARVESPDWPVKKGPGPQREARP